MRKLAGPLLGKYLIQNRAANLFIKITDAVLALCLSFPKRKFEISRSPRRILLANSAHMGDVLIMTSILPVLKEAFPDTEIGVLIGSWSLPIVKNLSEIERIHIVDHWKLNRANIPFRRKFQIFWKTRSAALKEIKATGYDVAIDLYCHFPNFIPLLWQARVPVRIGYTSGGFGPMLTHPRVWLNLDQHVSAYHSNLLQTLHIDKSRCRELHYKLSSSNIEPGVDVLEKTAADSSDYIVVHMGTGEAKREWPLSKWKVLSQELSEKGYSLVFTGIGTKEAENASKVSGGLLHSVNVCGKLSWDDFLSVIKKARLVICVESLAGHIAAAMDTDCVAIWSGMANHHHWRPLSASARVLLNPVPCAPCYRSRGCTTMDCVRDLQPQKVLSAVLEKLSVQSQLEGC